jgi:hypothetical protein
MKYWILFAPLFTSVAMAQSLVGATIPPDPNGFVHKTGACIAKSLGAERMCDYSVGLLQDTNGVPRLVYGARRLESRTAANQARWTVAATFNVPALTAGQYVAMATCRMDEVADETIVAIVQAEGSKAWNDKIILAKRFDFQTERFVDLPVADISCENVAHGL